MRRACAARTRAAEQPRMLPNKPSVPGPEPCSSWINNGRQPATDRHHTHAHGNRQVQDILPNKPSVPGPEPWSGWINNGRQPATDRQTDITRTHMATDRYKTYCQTSHLCLCRSHAAAGSAMADNLQQTDRQTEAVKHTHTATDRYKTYCRQTDRQRPSNTRTWQQTGTRHTAVRQTDITHTHMATDRYKTYCRQIDRHHRLID